MKRAFEAVAEFHRAYGVDAPETPNIPDAQVIDLRESLIREELEEYLAAARAGDIVGVADGLADLVYVVVGSAVAHGLVRFNEIFDEVHRSNMSKLGSDGKPIRRADGKVLKGPDYSPPNLEPFI